MKSIEQIREFELYKTCREHHSYLIERAPLLIIEVSRSGDISYANDDALRCLGYRLDELIGTSLLQYLNPKHHPQLFALLRTTPNKPVKQREVEITTKKQQTKHLLISASCIEDLTDHAAIALFAQDSSQLSSAAAATRAMAHDMNNVLAAIMTVASAIKLDLAETGCKAEDIDDILAACRRGRHLTRRAYGSTTNWASFDMVKTVENNLPQPAPTIPLRDAPPLGARNVLLVDDDEIVRQAAARILEKLGYSVIHAENGQVALDLYVANQSSIAFVVLDIIMPVLNGREALAKMREIDPTLKVLLVSGYTRDQKIDDLLEDRLTEFINKPFDLESLTSGIAKLHLD